MRCRSIPRTSNQAHSSQRRILPTTPGRHDAPVLEAWLVPSGQGRAVPPFALGVGLHGCKTPLRPTTGRRGLAMSNLVHNEQVKMSATFLNNLGVAVLVGVFLIPTFYTRHTMLQQALSIGVGLAAAVGLRIAAHWWLRRLRE